MLKAYKFRLYPDDEQTSKINSFIGSSRFVYNHNTSNSKNTRIQNQYK